MRRVGVIGGGVIGLATAYYLEKSGALPLVVDAGILGLGCSAGNAGWICPSISGPLPTPALTAATLLGMMKPGSPLYIKPSALPELRGWLRRFKAHCTQPDQDHGLRALATLNEGTSDRYRELAAAGVAFEHGQRGLLLAFRDPAKMASTRAEVDATASLGVASYRVLDRAALREMEPLLKPGFTTGLFVESDSHVRPETLTAGLADALRLRKVEIREQEPVTGFEWEGDRVQSIVTNRSTIHVDAVVLAAGAETGTLAAACGLALPLTAGKGYSITIEDPARQLQQPLYLGEGKVGLTPFDGALRIAGTMELSGINRNLESRRLKAIRKRVTRDVDIPEAESRGTEWVGMRPMLPDTLPVIGRIPNCPNVYISTGHQMLGITLSLSSGWALAQSIVEGRSPIDLSPFSPARF